MNVQPIELIPGNFHPGVTQNVSFADIAPNMTLPASKRYSQKRGIWTLEQMQRVGVSTFSNYDFPTEELRRAGKSFNDTPVTNTLWNLPAIGPNQWVGVYPDNYNTLYFPNGIPNEDWGKQKGRETHTAHSMQIFETEENVHYIKRSHPVWRGFYSTYIPRMKADWDANGIPSYVAHNYFNIGLPPVFYLGRATRQQHKDQLLKDIYQFPFTEYSPGGTLELCNLICEGIYPGDPASNRGNVFDAFYRMMLYKAMGKFGCTYYGGPHEWRPNVWHKTRYPEGDFYKQDKFPLDPNEQMSYAAMGFTLGIASIGWGIGNPGKTAQMNFDPDWKQGDRMISRETGATIPMTHYAAPGGERYGRYVGSNDFSHWGTLGYARTFGQTLGQNQRFYDYKIDNSAYRSGHVVDAKLDSQWMVYTEENGGQLAYWVQNPMADNNRHGVTFRDPLNVSKNFTLEVCGNAPHMGIITL